MGGEHYFHAEPGSTEVRRPLTVSVWGREMSLQTASGVFASGRLDVGTSVLFRETWPPARPGTFLDLGCGYGVIACALAAAVPKAAVWAVDVNERALRLCQENSVALGLDKRLRVSRPDQVPTGVEFDEIWSNPPIRVGKQALHDMLLGWFSRLSPTGRAVLVVGRNLGADSLQRWLGTQGFRCDRLASAKGFRVLEARPQ